jgi:Kef-type K+ transport system membrane component KefB
LNGLHYHPFLVIALIAVLAPLVTELPHRIRIPSVVLEIICGVVVGPQVLGWVQADAAMETLWNVGMCILFLLAGMEIDMRRIRGRPLRLALEGWFFSLALGIGAAFLLNMIGLVEAPRLVALALTTTTIGTLLPILRDAGELHGEFGILTLAAGAMGEFGPLLLLSVLPIGAEHSVGGRALAVGVFAVVAVVIEA